MSAKGQSQPNNQENKRPETDSPPSGPTPASQSAANDDDDDFVDISDEDTDMQDADAGHRKQPKDSLDLHRLAGNSDDLDDDSDEEHDNMASHPLLSMLTGRLGQRRRGSTHKWDRLHPVTGVLSVSNVDDCTELEIEAFPENERCSREKVSARTLICLVDFRLTFDAICSILSDAHGRLLGGHVPITTSL
jgi:hypothetical protein